MKSAVLVKVALWWVAILGMAILNGAFREELLVPWIGSSAGLIASGLTLSGVVFLVSYVAVPGFGRLSASQYWTIGTIWLVMTLIFEFSFGFFIERKPLSELLQAYTFKGGNVWPVVLAGTLISPRLAARSRGLL